MCPCVMSMHVPMLLCMVTELVMLRLKMCQVRMHHPGPGRLLPMSVQRPSIFIHRLRV